MNEEPAAPTRELSSVSLGAGALGFAWAIAIMLPDVRDLPAWPAATLGVIALVSSRVLPGRALPRGLGAFLGFVGLLIGVLKILALWGIVQVLES